mgnify:CR=1 FL=1
MAADVAGLFDAINDLHRITANMHVNWLIGRPSMVVNVNHWILGQLQCGVVWTNRVKAIICRFTNNKSSKDLV